VSTTGDTGGSSLGGGAVHRRPDQRQIGTSRAGTGPSPQNNTFVGRLVVIFGTGANSGFFVYSGSPALGNPPIFAITTASKDPYGNTVTASAITDSALPFLIYSGAPAEGTLVAAISPFAGGTDAYGNVYPQGTNFGIWSAAGALLQHFGVDSTGDIFLANNAGKSVIRGQASDGSLSFYNASGVGLGNVLTTIAPAAGSDPAGNTYVEGITVQGSGQIVVVGSGGSEIAAFISAGNPIMEWLSGYVNEQQPGYIQVNLFNIGGANEYVAMFMHGPEVTGQADSAFVELNSSQQNAANNAFGSLGYQTTAAAVIGMLNWGPGGINGMGQLTAVKPGTGTVAVAAVAESWHSVTIPATWTGSARVKILAESNFACFDCTITAPAAGATSGSFGALPSAGYYPLAIRVFPAGFTGAAAGTNARLNVNVSATGPTFQGLPAGFTGSLQMTVIYPLD
jgi:hypothetical protein